MARPDTEPEAAGRSDPLRNAAAFSVAAMFGRGIAFLALPLYTRAVTPAEYGSLGVLVAIAAAATILFSLALDQSIFRQYFRLESDPDQLSQYVATIWKFSLWFSLACTAVCTVLGFALLPPDGLFGPTELCLALLGAAAGIIGTAVPGSVLRAREALRPYVVLTVVPAVLAPAFGLLLVVQFELGIRGFLVGTLIANLGGCAAAYFLVPWRWGTIADRRHLTGSLSFSLPLVPHLLSHWALQIADRLLLATLVAADLLGRYSLAANMALPFVVVMSSLNQGFMPTYARAAHVSDRRTELRSTIATQTVLVIAITAVGIIVGPTAIRALTPESYHAAAPLVPWLVLGYGFLGLYSVPMNVAAQTGGRTKGIWRATVACAILNLSLVAFGVPSGGLLFAAQASMIGYLALFVLVSHYARRYAGRALSYDWRRVGPTLFLAIGACALAIVTTPDDIPSEIAQRLLILVAFAGSLVMFGVVPRPALRGRTAS